MGFLDSAKSLVQKALGSVASLFKPKQAPMVFNVGEGLNPTQAATAQSEVRKQVTPVGLEFGLPGTQKTLSTNEGPFQNAAKTLIGSTLFKTPIEKIQQTRDTLIASGLNPTDAETFAKHRELGSGPTAPTYLQKIGGLAYNSPLNTEQSKALNEQDKETTKGMALDILGITPIGEGEKVAGSFLSKAGKLIKERKFIQTVRGAATTVPEVAKAVSSFYEPISNIETLTKARQNLALGDQAALDIVKGSPVFTHEVNATGQLLMSKFQKEGKFNEAIDLAEHLAEQGTKAGQAVQAFAIWSRLTPEGALRYAARVAQKVTRETGVETKITEDLANEITKIAKKVQDFEPGSQDRIFNTARLMNKIHDIIPPGLGKQISSVQTIAQLLNPKTLIRNLGGNAVFSLMENMSDNIGAAVDLGISKFTGQRTKVLPDAVLAAHEGAQGLKLGIRDALAGVDTMNNEGGKVTTPVFKKGPLAFAEKTLGVLMKGPDRAFFQAAEGETLDNLMRAFKVTEPTQGMYEYARYVGLYRTFQDDSVLSRMFVGFKNAFNHIHAPGVPGFGLGDLIIKYAKTPANIFSRALDYSPAGFMKSMYHGAETLIGGNVESKAFSQRKFVESFSRAVVGSVTIGMGALMSRLGIITTKDKALDVGGLKNEEGFQNFGINASALKRFVLSGFNPEAAKRQPNDMIASYDWIQPTAIPLAIGADIDKKVGGEGSIAHTFLKMMMEGNLGAAVDSATTTLSEQPVLQGIERAFNTNQNPFVGALLSLASLPASFIPTLLYQVRQMVDPAKRDTYDPNVIISALNQLRNRVPGLSATLPAQKSPVTGQDLTTYDQGDNGFFNVFFNPAFVKQLRNDPEINTLLDIYDKTGDVSAIPNQAPRSMTIFGKSLDLNNKSRQSYNGYVGDEFRKWMGKMAVNDEFTALDVSKKADTVSSALKNINKAAKLRLLSDSFGVKVPESVSKQDLVVIYNEITTSEKWDSYSEAKKKEVMQRMINAASP